MHSATLHSVCVITELYFAIFAALKEQKSKSKVLPEPYGPSGGADLRFHSPQPDTSSRCQTTDTGLVHRAVRLFTSQPKPVPIYTAW